MADYNFTIVEEVTNINVTPPVTEEVNIEVDINENINNFGENAGVDLSAYQKTDDADLKYSVKNHTHAYSELTELPTLFSGNYNDLTNKPTIPSLAGYATETWATGQFQPKGNYLTSVTWNNVSGKPTSFTPSAHTHTTADVNGLATVATSGSYNDLTDKPTIPSAQVNSDWNATSGSAQILNKPTLFSGNYADLTDKPSTFAPSAHTHAISEVTGLQTELNGKSASTHTHDSIIQTNGNTALQFWKGTQAQYDAIVTKDSNTIYFII